MPNSDIASIISKNWGGSEHLPSLQAEKLACHGVIDAGKRHETLHSETGDLLCKAQQHNERHVSIRSS